MPDKEKDSYELLLERLDAQDKKIEALTNELQEMTKFNRALLARNPGAEKGSQPDVQEKFNKFLEGE